MGRGVYTYRFASSVKEPAPPQPDPVPVLSGTKVAGYTFDTGAQGWTTSTTDPLGRGWKHTTSGARGSAGAFAFDQYSDATTSTLTSPAISHPGGAAAISYSYKVDTEPGYDPVTVQWSSDGKAWNTVGTLNGQNGNYPGYDVKTHTFTVPAGKVFLRFVMTSDDNTSWPLYDGVGVDDVTLLR